MPDVRAAMQRKLENVKVPAVTFESFLRRRERMIRRRRVAAGVIAIVIAVATLGTLLRAIDRSTGVPGATPTAPKVVPLEPAGSIAFARSTRAGDSIYLYEPSGTVSRLVDLRCTGEAPGRLCGGRVSGLGFSPDGIRLAYTLRSQSTAQGTPGKDGLYVMDLRTGVSTRIVACDRPECVEIAALAWSPAGTSIAYTADAEIHLVAPDGSEDRRLDIGLLYAYGLAWSGGGSRIVFSGSEDDQGVGGDLFSVGANASTTGGAPVEPVDVGDAAPELIWSFSLHPDDGSIALAGSAAVAGASSRARVWISDSEGNAEKLEGLGLGWQRAVSWSPDGSHIAVMSNGHLITIRPDGTGRQELAKTWSPEPPAWYPAT